MKNLVVKSILLGLCASTIVGSSLTTTEGYEELTSNAAGTSELVGNGTRTNKSTAEIVSQKLGGTLTHASKTYFVTDNQYAIVDADGFDANGVLTDGTAVLTKTALSDGYKYVMTYQESYNYNGADYETNGVLGVATRNADMPALGVATYDGKAEAVVARVGGTTDILKDGTSKIEVDFAASTVDLTLNGFTATDLVSGLAVNASIDTIRASGMTISGNKFSSGSLSLQKNGVEVDATGANSTASSVGYFYGQDAIGSTPAEAAGTVLKGGDAGTVSGIFVAK